MGKFKDPKGFEESISNLTGAVPADCSSCGHEFADDAKNENRGQVNCLSCRDLNRGGKIITGTPSRFLKEGKVNNHERPLGNPSSGYQLKDNFEFERWIIWCGRCHTNKTKLSGMHRKSNHMKSDGVVTKALSIEQSLNKLKKIHAR